MAVGLMDAFCSKMAQHIGVELTPAEVDSVVAASSFSRMRGSAQRAEEEGGGSVVQGARGSRFFRKGVAGDWMAHFTEVLRVDFDAICHQHSPLGPSGPLTFDIGGGEVQAI